VASLVEPVGAGPLMAHVTLVGTGVTIPAGGFGAPAEEIAFDMFRPAAGEFSTWERFGHWVLSACGYSSVVEADLMMNDFRTACEHAAYNCESVGVRETRAPTQTMRTLAYPDRVVEAALELRTKFGMSVMNRATPGNIELVRVNVPKALAKQNVRLKEQAAMLPLVEDAFFDADLLYRIPTAKRRAIKRSWLVRCFMSEEQHKFDF
jgi:hypothetical protein